MGIKHPGEYFKKKLVFETDRLSLRKLEITDVSDLYRYASKEDTSRYLLWSPHPNEHATRYVIENILRDYRAGKYTELAIVLRESGRMIGTCGFTTFDTQNMTAEIGYVISPDYWGMGLACEAVSAIVNFAFCELGVKRIEAKYMVENHSSRRVMEKLGMTFEGVQRSKLFVKGRFRDIGICSILSEEYFSVPRENLFKKFNNIGLFDSLFKRIK